MSWPHNELTRLAALLPPDAVLGVGGSVARGEPDERSDVDVFVFFGDGDALTHAQRLRRCYQPSAVTSVGEVKFAPGWGYKVSYIVHCDFLIELFVNTPASWTPSVKRLETHVICGTSPRYDALIALTREMVDTPGHIRRVMGAVLHDLGVEVLELLKQAGRCDLLELQYRVVMVRRLLLAVLCFSEGLIAEPDPQLAKRRTEALVPELACQLKCTHHVGGVADVCAVIHALRVLADRVSTSGVAGHEAVWGGIRRGLANAQATLERRT